MTTTNDVMTHDLYLVAPEETIARAALLMSDKDVGSIPVTSDDKLVGMLTDRDIAVRGIARNRGPETPVREIMSGEVKYCFDDDDIEDVARNMAELQVRRLPVVNRDKRLVGFISLSNISGTGDPATSATLLQGVATPH